MSFDCQLWAFVSTIPIEESVTVFVSKFCGALDKTCTSTGQPGYIYCTSEGQTDFYPIHINKPLSS